MGLRRGKSFREMLLAAGYDPGEAMIVERFRCLKEADEVKDALQTGTYAGKPTEGRRLMAMLYQRVAELDEKLLPYAHPRLSASKVDANVDAGGSLLELLTRDRAPKDSD